MSDDPILRQRRVALTQADTGLLLGRMLREIPGLKVVDRATISWPAQMPEAADPYLRYWNGEGDPPDIDVMLWLEPEGWKEKWEYRRHCDEVVLANVPDTACCFEVCWMNEGHAGDLTPFMEEVQIIGEVDDEKLKGLLQEALKEQLTLMEGRLFGVQDKEDASQRAFLDKIFGILEEECSDRLIWWLRGDEPSLNVLKGFVWAGPDAMRWALKAENRYLTHGLRPLEGVPPELRSRTTESYGLHITEDKWFHDFIGLSVPARWPVFTTPEGRGIACDEDSDNGTLWVEFNAYRTDEDAAKKLAEASADATYGNWAAKDEYCDVMRVKVDGREGVYGEAETIEDGEPLRVYSWVIISPIDRYLVTIFIHLVLTHDNLADPRCEGVVETIKNAVANIRIDEEAFLERVAAIH